MVILATVAKAADVPSYDFYSTSTMSAHGRPSGRISHVQVAAPAPAADYSRVRGTAKGQVYSASVFSQPKMQVVGGVGGIGGGGSVSYSASSSSRGGELNGSVGVTSIHLPALRLHNKNAAALTAVTEETENIHGHIRRSSSDPIDPEEDDVFFPIGDGLWVMIFLALAYGVARVKSERMNELTSERMNE